MDTAQVVQDDVDVQKTQTWRVDVAVAGIGHQLTYRIEHPYIERGALVQVPLRKRTVSGVVMRAVAGDSAVSSLRQAQVVASSHPVPARVVDLVTWVAGYYACDVGPAFAGVIPSGVKRGIKAGRTRQRTPVTTPPEDHVRTAEQQSAAEAIIATLGRPAVHVLCGVTGSGKTLVYMDAIAAAVAHGGQALFLLPEIGLTPQMESRVRHRFPDAVVWHSGLADGQRAWAWNQVASGAARVVVGARSAIFAPFADLRLAVCDEEHDASYKSHAMPRYHARDTLLRYARIGSFPVVLGSATPSLETIHGVQQGRFQQHLLRTRPGAAVAPQVLAVDMRAACRNSGTLVEIAPELIRAVGQAHARGEQSIVLLNRRGWNTSLRCVDCGWSSGCSQCSIGMTYHREADHLRCHLCGTIAPRPTVCPDCLGRRLRPGGLGVERLADHLARMVPGLRVARLDADVVGSVADMQSCLGGFGRHETDCLVGTQMVSKGLNFPNVTVVGIVGADRGLSVPDYMAGERAFQLIVQTIGRAGRGQRPGTVVVQAWRPEDRIVQAALTGDREGFVAAEMATRQAARLPPFAALARLLWSGTHLDRVMSTASTTCERLLSHLGSDCTVAGPMPAPIERIRGEYRVHAIVRGPSRNAIQRALISAKQAGDLVLHMQGTTLTVDVDPIDTQ